MTVDSRPVIVLKFGGTSVGSVARIQRVALRAIAARQAGRDVVVVVSAMSGETNRLLALAKDVAEIADRREKDALAATGEQASAALTAIAITAVGGKARSFCGHQLPILTDTAHGDARILEVRTEKLRASLAAGEIPVVAGFQGVTADGSTTTLGRGGSDTTAVALAAALKAESCDIYTDVDGVYTADPNICPGAVKLPHIPYRQMSVLASLGAKVLHDRSVELAKEHGVAVHVRTSFSDEPGTWVTDDGDGDEALSVCGLAADKHVALVQLREIAAARDLEAALALLKAKSVPITDVFADARPLAFTVRAAEVPETRAALKRRIAVDALEDVARVSIVGSGLSREGELVQKALSLLGGRGLKALRTTVTGTTFSVLVDRREADEVMRLLHDGLDLATASEAAARRRRAGMRYGRELAD